MFLNTESLWLKKTTEEAEFGTELHEGGITADITIFSFVLKPSFMKIVPAFLLILCFHYSTAQQRAREVGLKIGVLETGKLNSITDVPLWSVLTMGLIILPVSFTCLNLAPRYTSAAIVSLLMLLEMVIGPFWVWLGVGEQPTIIMMAGAGFVALVLGLHILRTQWFTNS